MDSFRGDAELIWKAGVRAVDAEKLINDAVSLTDDVLYTHCVHIPFSQIQKVVIVGAGKAGGRMAASAEGVLSRRGVLLHGIVNVPNAEVVQLRDIELNGVRSSNDNQPTEEGVRGAKRIMEMVESCSDDDVCICLLSGGASALMPLPTNGITLKEKRDVTELLHKCGASISEMNAVRKHISAIKGGGLVKKFKGKILVSLIISDVIDDPLDVIASGPTSADPTTFANAIDVLNKYDIFDAVPQSVRSHLEDAQEETLKELPKNVKNLIIGNYTMAIEGATKKAEDLGYTVINLGVFDGDTTECAQDVAGRIRSKKTKRVCYLSSGETTVELNKGHGLGGRNMEFVLAMTAALGEKGMQCVTILSGGTDGEDGPTDASGAVSDVGIFNAAKDKGLDLNDYLVRHDSYTFFDACDGLIKTGFTGTNVMDLRVILVH